MEYRSIAPDAAPESRWRQRIGRAALAAQLFMTVTGFAAFLHMDMSTASTLAVRSSTVAAMGLVILSCFFISIMRQRLSDDVNFLFLFFVAGCSFYLYTDEMSFVLPFMASDGPFAYAVATLAYLDTIFLDFVFCQFCYAWYGSRLGDHPAVRRALYFLTAVSCLLILGNLWGGYYFTLLPDGTIVWGSGDLLSYLAPGLMVLIGIRYILRQKTPRLEKAVGVSVIMIPGIASFVMEGWGSLFFSVCVSSLVVLYSALYMRRETVLAQREAALTKSRLDALRLQVNPHFLYNAFASVASLCVSDPMAARKMISRLTDFLRDNFTDITQAPVRPFTEEIRNVEQYLAIELIHYPRVKIRYDLAATHFLLPCLSVQPLVENAIKHGIMKRRDVQGTITIRSWEEDNAYIVRVEDDGVGFAGELPAGGDHIGVRNVALRLSLISRGSLSVTSRPGEGTVCELVIPKEETEDGE